MRLPLAEGFKEKKAQFIGAGADAAEVEQVMARFKQLKQRRILQGSELNIDSYESFDQLKEIVSQREQDKSKTQKKKQTKLEGATVIADTPEWLVLSPHNREASQFYGKGTKWCISGDASQQHWCTYRGKLWKHYFFLSKTRKPDDIYYKIAVSAKPEGGWDIRDAPDEEVTQETFEQVTGFKLPDYKAFEPDEPSLSGEEKWSLMGKKNMSFTDKVKRLKPQEWQALGNKTTAREEWMADDLVLANAKEQGKDPVEMWAEFWEQSRRELLADPGDEEYARKLEYAMESTAQRLANQLLG